MFESNNCGFCGSNLVNSGRHRNDGIQLLSCEGCQASRVESISTDLAKLYRDDYFQSDFNSAIGYTGYGASNLGKLLWVKQLSNLLFPVPCRSILDIGCADGSLLSLFSDQTSKFGIEPNLKMAGQLNDRGIRLLGEYLETAELPQKFDLAIGISLLEHLVDPFVAMEKMVQHLETEGIFVIDVPCDSGKDDDIWLSTSLEHLWHPNLNSLSTLLSRVGCSWFSVHEIDIASFGKTCIAFGGSGSTPKNLHRIQQLIGGQRASDLTENEKKFVFCFEVLYRNHPNLSFEHLEGMKLNPAEQNATIALLLERIVSFDKLRRDYESVVEAKEYHIEQSKYWKHMFSKVNLDLIGLVVPTLGKRPDLLVKSLQSIKDNGVNNVCLVTKSNEIGLQMINEGLISQFVIDEDNGLSAAINLGFRSLPDSVEFVGWLGDDDVLEFNSAQVALDHIATDGQIVLAYGSCNYIDVNDAPVWKNKSGRFASQILRFGPCLIPQPGSLIRRSAFNEVGGLNEQLGWAFDLDLYIKLSKVGKLKYINETLASFRWHPDSLSVEYRKHSVREASLVRKSYLHSYLKKISEIWELPIRQLTFHSRRLVRPRNSKMQAK